jgi:hypothetical protein
LHVLKSLLIFIHQPTERNNMKMYLALANSSDGKSIVDCGRYATAAEAYAAIEALGLVCAELETVFTPEKQTERNK